MPKGQKRPTIFNKAKRQPKVLRLHLAGWTQMEIAAHLGASRCTIANDIKQLREEGHLTEDLRSNVKALDTKALLDSAKEAINERLAAGDERAVRLLLEIIKTENEVSGGSVSDDAKIGVRRVIRSLKSKTYEEEA